MNSTPASLALAVCLLVPPLWADADQFAQLLREHTGNPPGVEIEVRFASGKSTFRQGERIELELVFQSAEQDKYMVSSAWYAEFTQEQIRVQPDEGWADPREAGDWVTGGRAGSFLSGIDDPGRAAAVVRFDLNRVLRFDQPGSYRITFMSTRLARRYPSAEDPGAQRGVSLLAEPLTVTITAADPDWLAGEIAAAKAILQSEASAEERQAAAYRLAYLPGRDAAITMVDALSDPDARTRQALLFGLVGGQEKQFLGQYLAMRMADPLQPVPPEFLRALLAAEASIRAQSERIDRERDASLYWKRLSEWQAELALSLAEAVPAKTGRARAVSLQTVLSLLPGNAPGHTAQSLAALESLRALGVEALAELDPAGQESLLRMHWNQIGGPGALPVLRRIYEAGREQAGGPVDQRRWAYRGAASAALERLAELDAGGARAIVISEIAKPPYSVELHSLLALRDERLPELDEAILAQWTAGAQVISAYELGQILHRYASDELFEPLVAVFEERAAGCQTPPGLLAYFLRVNPEWALAQLKPIFASSAAEDSCQNNLLNAIGQLEPHPGLTEIAIDLLSSSKLSAAREAAEWLASQQVTAALDPMWRRLEALHEGWAGRQDELAAQSRKPTRDPVDSLEMALAHAIRAIEGNDDSLPRLRQLCVSARCRQELGP